MIDSKNFRGPKRAPKHRWIGVVVALVLSALAAISLLALEPLDPRPVSTPANEFSAERAFSHVEQVGERPHPVGSAANAEVRDYLVGQLEDLGLQPTIQEATSARTKEGTASMARVENIHARIEGRNPTGHVVLVAHYDSVPRGPGAADDGAGVAAILEIARAITSGSAPRNDIDILLTDAEEPWLLGAQAFVRDSHLDPRRSVVLNLEARGTSGPAMMFQSSSDNATLIPALASAQRPITGSGLWEACSQLLTGDTDFTVFRNAGFAGMNFAFMEGSARYHTPEDSPDNLDHASVQDIGSTVLAATRHFADQDLGAPRSGSLTYFTVLGEVVYYPQFLAVPLAVLAAVAFVATLLYARGRRGVRIRFVGWSAASFLALLVVIMALGIGAWQVLLLPNPGYGSFHTGDTYRPEWYAAGLLVLTAALTIGWYLLQRRRTPEEIILGTWAWFVVLALTTAAFVPGAAYLFTWTPLVGCLLLAAAIRWGGQEPTWRYLALSAGAVPAVALLGPLVDVFFFLGLAFASGPMFMAVLVLVTALPVLDLLALRRAWIVPVAALVVGLGLFAAGLRIDTFDDEHPRQTRLVYALDADQEQAWWLSADPDLPLWTDRYVDTERMEDDRFPDSPSLSLASSYYSGPASVARIEPPDVTVRRSERNGDTRELRLRITPAEASRLALYADTRTHTVMAATVDGINVEEVPGQREDTDPSRWGFVFHGVPPEGIDVTLKVRGEGPLPLRVIGYRDGLPRVPELTPLPDELTWSGTSSNLTMIAMSYRV